MYIYIYTLYNVCMYVYIHMYIQYVNIYIYTIYIYSVYICIYIYIQYICIHIINKIIGLARLLQPSNPLSSTQAVPVAGSPLASPQVKSNRLLLSQFASLKACAACQHIGHLLPFKMTINILVHRKNIIKILL